MTSYILCSRNKYFIIFSILFLDCLSWIGLQELSKHYYTYKGSLTTAPYFESVTWIIYRTPIYVSRGQVSLDPSSKELYR